jgi:CRP/FNR family transcriptional regulator, cyclic AMP receptor protein
MSRRQHGHTRKALARSDQTVISYVTGGLEEQALEDTIKWHMLDSLSETDRRTLLSGCHRQRFAKGEHVFHEGDPGDSVYLIDRGTLAVRVTSATGDVATLDVLRPGEAFGVQALLDKASRRSAAIVALEHTETLRFSRAEFEALWKSHPKAAWVVAEMLDARLRATSQALLEALYVPAETRVLRKLGKLADIYAHHSSEAIPLTQDDLASMAGTTRQTVNRVLRQAQDDGLIILARGRIRVSDKEGLARRAR